MGDAVINESELNALPLLDAASCDDFKELMSDDFENLCQGFQQDITDAVSQIAAAGEAETHKIAELAHKYKSAAGYIGAFRLRSVLEQLEIVARKDDFISCQRLTPKALEIAQQSTQALQDYLANHQ